jgi:predicted 3-demethylubiquinone-9 3-methyltransferase (glyoxalase superfamily)
VGVFLSNINYLAEQANYLNHYLKTVEGLPGVPVAAMPINNTASTIETLSAAIANAAPANQTNASQQSEITLHERLSEQTSNTSLADTLKRQSSIKDLSFSVNDKMFIVSNLFDDNQNDFNRIMSHVATLDAWDEVEIYLNETCTIPYQWENKEADKKHFFRILKQRFA